MNFLFRPPKFPVLLDTGERLLYANNQGQLKSKIAKIGFTDDATKNIIDSQVQIFWLKPVSMVVSPGFINRQWTKLQIIELYNARRQQGEPELRSTSLGNRRLDQVFSEVFEQVSRNAGSGS
ncbi:MAG: hypothetical protein V4772_27555 [Pseudomonadota bacterium]